MDQPFGMARDEAAAVTLLQGAQVTESSKLVAPPAEIWPRIASAEGINNELMPIASLTFPAGWGGLDADSLTRGEELFGSTLKLFGILPIDRHDFSFMRVTRERGFLEYSSSRMNRDWIHERTLAPLEGGTEIVDRVFYRSRLPGFDRLSLPLLRFVFRHRHRKLRGFFGELNPNAPNS